MSASALTPLAIASKVELTISGLTGRHLPGSGDRADAEGTSFACGAAALFCRFDKLFTGGDTYQVGTMTVFAMNTAVRQVRS
jgi:hypothetical protein